MKLKYNYANVLFLTLSALALGMCIYENAIYFKPRCLISVGILTFMTYMYFRKREYITKLKTKNEMQDFLMNSFAANTPDLMTYTDKNYRYITCNKTMSNILGLKDIDEIRNTTAFDYFTDAQAQLIHKFNKNVLETGKSVKYLLYLENEFYGEKIYETISVPVQKHKKNIGIVTICRDITFREKLQKKFAEKQNQLSSILNNLPMAAFLMDTNGKFISGNSKIGELLNLTQDDLQGCDIFTTYLEETNEELDEQINTIINEGKTVTVEHFFKFPNTKPSWYKIYESPIYNNAGEIQGITVFIQNIGAEKEIARQQEHFIATLSHDLKTPIIAQTRSLELLLKGTFGEVLHAQKEVIELTHESCRLMYNMVSTILNSYKFDNKEIRLCYSRTPIIDVIMECCDELERQIQDKKVEIVINSKIKSTRICADRKFIKSAILYMIENSISYAYENTKVIICVEETNNEIIFTINTKSPYIPKGTLNSMFDRYLGQTANYNKIGFCLKLYYTSQIINAHLGEIIAESDKSNKNTLGFKIPKNKEAIPVTA